MPLVRGDVPADLVLVCGVFGNISREDISRTIQALPGFCRMGSEVIWTRHRRPPDATPSIRAEFAAAGFTEVAFEAPDDYVLAVGRHRLDGGQRPARRVRPGADAVRVRRRRLAAGVSADGARRAGPARIASTEEAARTGGETDAHSRSRPTPDRRYLRCLRQPRRPSWAGTRCIPSSCISMGRRTARLEPARVLVPALVIFGLDAFQGTWLTEISTDHLGLGSVAGVVVFGASTLGLTFYSGMLERLVGAVERNQTPQPVSQVLATLPWFRLLFAEASSSS